MNNSIKGAGGSNDDLGASESWEAADVEESMKRLLLSTSAPFPPATELDFDAPVSETSNFASSSSSRLSGKSTSLSEEAINQVDQFLRDALQNPRERLSILRMEQDVENFIRDPTAQQMEFQQLPTSYQRLAAHRVAQHYFLQSMVLLDNNLPEGASRIIVRKTSDECRYPRIRLADIPVNLPKEDSGVVKLAIKQRPQKHLNAASGFGSGSGKANQSKSVEERKEEYDRARARIFNSSAHTNIPSAKPKNEPRRSDSFNHAPVGVPKVEKHSVSGGCDLSTGRSLTVTSSGSSRSARSRIEKEPVGRQKSINKVAIIRDREVDSKDPDYDRSYDRYMQRFDPGFGFNTGPYPIQPMYAPAVNYNTEFPQLAPAHQQAEHHQSHPSAQHLPSPWLSPSNPMGYGHPEAMMAYNPNHISARPNSAIYIQSSQFPGQHPGMPFIHSHEHMHQPFSQARRAGIKETEVGLELCFTGAVLFPGLGLNGGFPKSIYGGSLSLLYSCC
ncbi:hypothetical protein V2J09_013561 [Rumex salicifolius]